jgi:DNA-binding response OmpR family regulator
MIAIISSDSRERTAFQNLCATRGFDVGTNDTIQSFRRSLEAARPRVVVTRFKLTDGYSDDVLSALRTAALAPKVIVLVAANSPQEARQIALGADCVLRDPIRPDVLLEYISKYRVREPGSKSTHNTANVLTIAGATLEPAERRLSFDGGTVSLTPREVSLARRLAASPGEILSYDDLFDDVLGRPFRGDTSNMRVLLGKLCGTAATIGLDLRACIEVIPKTGYRYRHGESS